MHVPAPAIITCSEWGARPPKVHPTAVGRPVRTIFHHTAGHAAGDTRDDAIAYARALQADMIDRRDWNDSGHNFLVMRSGLILQGRWGTVSAIEHGYMVESAHCPGQNDQPGIEHEHVDSEPLTTAQLGATFALHAWIMDRCRIRPTEVYPHRHFFNTACPGSLGAVVLDVRLAAARILTAAGSSTSTPATIASAEHLRAELDRIV